MQLADDIVGYCHDLFEHLDLLFVADHGDLCGFEEEVRRGTAVYVEVDLGADLLEQDEVAFKDQLHLDFVQQHCLLFVLRRVVLFFRTEVVYLLVELLVLLQIVLKFVYRFFCYLVKLILLSFYGSGFFNSSNGFLFSGCHQIFLTLYIHLVVINLFTK